MLKKYQYIIILLLGFTSNGFCSILFQKENLSGCKPPTNIKIIASGIDFATLTWKSNNNGIAWKIKWRKVNEDYSDSNTSSLLNEKQYQITGLEPSSKYYFKLQTLCSDDSESKWSFEYSFVTHLENPTNCDIHLKLQDAVSNNDKTIPGKTVFYIKNEEFPDGKLGIDVFIQNVKLIIDHSWTNDLTVKLWSPSGKSTVLTSTHKAKDESSGYGNSTLTDCVEPIVFSDVACQKLSKETSQFIGDFRPDQPLSSLYDSLSPFGDWKLEIIDKSLSNSGFLEYVEIDFEPLLCPIPQNVSIIPQNETAVLINWEQNDNVDSVFFKLVTNGINNIVKSDDSGFYILSGLNSNDNIFISLQSKCNNIVSAFSCLDSISFLCGTAQLREGFDSYEECSSSCDDCLNKGIWFNNSNQNWLINSGETTTKNTGPSGDAYGSGKYIYFESSSSDCNNQGFAILQSQCIYVEPAFDGCSMEFSYHMYGVDIGSLSLEISVDNGESWDTLFLKQGEVSENWIKQEILLDKYENRTCQFRFVATSLNQGSYGDIAIDDIILYNSVIADENSYLYYPDRDGDGFGKDTTGLFFCNLTSDNFVSNNEDCDDNDSSINPAADEILCNFIDENCNGMEDDTESEFPFTIKLDSIINESCNGKRDGKIVLKISDGIPPYSFQWSNGSIDSVLTDVAAGKYRCIITDQSGCGLVTDTFAIKYNELFNFEVAEKQLPTCNGKKNGSIEIDFSGGTLPYKYKWNTGDTLKNITNLTAGNYSITIVDSTGCIYNSPDIELKATTIFDIGLIEKVNPSCYDSENGKINLRVLGGTAPYSADWNNSNENLLNISNLKAGEYFCTITDAELCYQEYGPITLEQPDSLEILISSIDHVTCYGENNGLIEIDTKGGTTPYTFEWKEDNKVISRSDDLYNLEVGKYTIIVSDNNGCTKRISDIEIKTIDSLSIKLDSLKNVNCSGTKDGFISINASGGYGDYYYFWSTGNTSSNTIDSLNTGLYSVTVEDDLYCKQVLSNLEISNLNVPLNLDLNVIENIKCFGDTGGAIIANVISNTPPFDYNWSAGTKVIKSDPVDTLINLPVGVYNVTVTDNFGCVGTSNSVTLLQPDKLVLEDIEVDNVLCYGDNTGKISVSVSGGLPPYTAIWNNGMDQMSISKLVVGNYTAEISDSNKCILNTGEITISQPDEIKVFIESYPAHKDKSDGYAIVLPTGGVTPYKFLWDENANFQTSNKAVNLHKGSYTVTLTDYNECSKEIKVFITESSATLDIAGAGIKIYPNPASDELFIIFESNIYSKYNIELIDITGKIVPFNYRFLNDKEVRIPLVNIENGIYFIHIFNSRNHYYQKVVVLH